LAYINDGNGRTARLLMNLILIQGGLFPEYIRSLQQEQAGEGTENFDALLYRRLDETLVEYLSVLQGARTWRKGRINQAIRSQNPDCTVPCPPVLPSPYAVSRRATHCSLLGQRTQGGNGQRHARS